MDKNIKENEEIEKALKEFGEKNSQEIEKEKEQGQDIDSVLSVPKSFKKEEQSRMVRLVIKISGGAIKDEKQAEYVLLTLAIVIFGISLIFWIK